MVMSTRGVLWCLIYVLSDSQPQVDARTCDDEGQPQRAVAVATAVYGSTIKIIYRADILD